MAAGSGQRPATLQIYGVMLPGSPDPSGPQSLYPYHLVLSRESPPAELETGPRGADLGSLRCVCMSVCAHVCSHPHSKPKPIKASPARPWARLWGRVWLMALGCG